MTVRMANKRPVICACGDSFSRRLLARADRFGWLVASSSVATAYRRRAPSTRNGKLKNAALALRIRWS